MDALLDHRAHPLMTYITSCLYWTHPPGHLLLMALCWMLGKFKVFQRHPVKIILRKVQRQNFLDEWKCRSFPEDKKPWQWASGWASGEDNGQNKKELSCRWDWERLTVGGRDLSLPFSRGKTDSLLLLCCIPCIWAPSSEWMLLQEKSVAQWGEQEPWSQRTWGPSCLFLSSSVTLGRFPMKWGYQGLSPEFTVRKKSGHECIS